MAIAYFRAIDLWVIGSARGKFSVPGELLPFFNLLGHRVGLVEGHITGEIKVKLNDWRLPGLSCPQVMNI